MTTRLVLLQGGLPAAPATLSASTTIPETSETATEKNSGWVVPRPPRWTPPYSTPSERAPSPTIAHRLRDDPSAGSIDCAHFNEQTCSACDAGHPSSCASLGIRDAEFRQARDEGDPPACA